MSRAMVNFYGSQNPEVPLGDIPTMIGVAWTLSRHNIVANIRLGFPICLQQFLVFTFPVSPILTFLQSGLSILKGHVSALPIFFIKTLSYNPLTRLFFKELLK